MGKPTAADRAVPPKTQATRKGVKFKVSQELLLTAPSSGEPHAVAPVAPVAPVVAELPPGGPGHGLAGKHDHPSSRAGGAAQLNQAGYSENFGSLPDTYHHDSLFLTARDPHWLFSYWDFDWSRVNAGEMRDGRCAYFLRVSRLSGEIEALVEIHPGARNWYVPVRDGGTTYAAELGYFDRRGVWHALVRSGQAHTPADALAEESRGESFASVPFGLTFEKLQELVQQHMGQGETLLEAVARITGEGRIQIRSGAAPIWTDEQKRLLAMLLGESLINVVGLGSEEIDRLLRKALQEKLHSEAASGLSARLAAAFGPSGASLFSPLGASWSGQPFGVPRERGFSMHLNAEVIFYGGTQPDATVRVNGQKIQLQPDGTFRYHFTLPDGDFEIPVEAVSADGLETRSGTLSFSRQTRTVGGVDPTAQPAYLEPLMGRRHG